MLRPNDGPCKEKPFMHETENWMAKCILWAFHFSHFFFGVIKYNKIEL